MYTEGKHQQIIKNQKYLTHHMAPNLVTKMQGDQILTNTVNFYLLIYCTINVILKCYLSN